MRLMIASDIHGNADVAEKLIERFHAEGCDYLLLLGDIIAGYYSMWSDDNLKRTAAALNSIAPRIYAVRGNCDGDGDQSLLEFSIQADYLQLPANGITLFATHGHFYGPHHIPPIGSGDILVSGHTHVPEHTVHQGMLCINPGSAGRPRAGSKAGYIIFDENGFTWKDLATFSEYDHCNMNSDQ